MKNKPLIGMIPLILALTMAGMVEYVYANVHKDCSCCNNQCSSKESCHEKHKECVCGSLAHFQVYLFENELLSKPDLLSQFTPKLPSIYVYLSVKSIFHPPRKNLL